MAFGFGILFRFLGRLLAIVLGILLVNKAKDMGSESKFILGIVIIIFLIIFHLGYLNRPPI